jgi:tetratricopeptide (TPR) repeat protein/CHAT domain-containing protein
MFGILAVDDSFNLMYGEAALRPPRHLDAVAVAALEDYGRRYYELLRSPHPAAGLIALGRELYRWLDGDGGHLYALLQRAIHPLRFEVCAANLYPSPAEWSLLRAPWELLANHEGFLAADAGLGFSPVRRLGRQAAAPPLGRHRLGLMFMAASPRGVRELGYEAEETAIMAAVGSTKLDLLVEESGNPDELGDRLSEYEAMQVLHLSCHGNNAWRPPDKPKPVLMLEDLEGEELPTDAGALIGALRAHRPRLVFLSACLTAAAGGQTRGGLPGDKEAPAGLRGGVAHSLAEALVDAGLPAVLGWDGSVADGAATAFAAKLYDGLEGRQDLADAVATARRDLLNAPEEGKRRDWHLARVWLGPQGGGPIVGGLVRRPMMPATHGQKEFLDKKSQVPVASHEMFVGRRRELQKALRALRESDYAGVLLHGMGRLGKSSLAARIANRRRDLRLAVVFGRYGALDVLAALSEALKENPKTRDLLREGTNLVGQQPDRLEDVLTDLLCGPCSQTGADGSPVLLVIDDLEQILEADPRGGRHRVAPSHAPVLRAVLGAFDAALHVGNSRVVVTSRFPFVLGGLERRLFELPLPPLSEAAQRKLELRQKEAAVDAGLTGKALTDREKLLKRVPAISQGNPGLQDLIGRKLILSTAVTLARAERTVEEMEAWLARGDLPSDAEVRAFLENLAVDALLDLAGAAGQALLCGLTLFDLPVPQTVAEKLEAHLGGSVRHLRDLGLLDVFADRVDHRQPALAVNALAAGRLEPLHDGERSVVAHAVAHDLFIAWGGVGEIETRPSVCDLQLAQLGLMAEDDEIVSACAAFAVAVLNQGPAAVAATFGQAAIRLLDTKQVTVPWRLLGETAEASATSGDGATADALLMRGVAALEQQRKLGASVDPVAAVFLVHEQARRLVTRGRLDEAKVLFAEAARYAEEAGQELSATIARGAIANILYRRGDLDEALRIRREEELPVYERLGDVRSRAITMGQIADILESRGDLDEALRIRREEELPVYERLGDVRSRAVTLGKIADILYRRGDLDEALRIRREEQLPVFERLGDVRERAVTMGKIADILYSRGDPDEALRIRREEQLPVFERLGDVRERAVTMSKIADILQSRGDLDEALRIFRQELLPAFERLDDVRSRAVVLGRIADILVQKGDRGAARALQDERLETNRGLADADGIGAALWDMAQLDLAERKIDDAIPRIMDAYGIVARLGRAEGIAVIGRLFGQILVANDKSAEARVVLQRSADAFRKLGREADAQEVEELICELNLK